MYYNLVFRNNTRTVRNDYTIQLNLRLYQIERKSKVTVQRRLDGTMRIRRRDSYLKFHEINQTKTTSTKDTNSRAATAYGLRPPAMATKPRRKSKPAPDHP